MRLHTLKSLCMSKETMDKAKIQLIDWEKLFPLYTLDKELIFRIYQCMKRSTTSSINLSENGERK